MNAHVVLRAASDQGEFFFPNKLRGSLNVDPHSPEGREATVQLGNVIDTLEESGLVDWNVVDGVKQWFVTEKGRAQLAN